MKSEKYAANPIHVLLMEDDPAVSRLIERHLTDQGFTVDTAPDGESGLAMFNPGTHDILLVDHKMPKRAGLDVLREFRKRGLSPAAILISGLGAEEVAVEALKLGALDYVAKDPQGLFLKHLGDSITNAIQRHRENEKLRIADEEQTRWLHELKQRIRELGCLYGIEKLLSAESESIDTALETAVNLVPCAARNPDNCWVRLLMNNREYRSDAYIDSPWKIRIDLDVRDGAPSFMEVGHREHPPEQDEQLFSPEEMELLNSVADRLADFYDRWRTEYELHVTHEEIRKMQRALEQSASAVIITNPKGTIEYVNAAFTVMTGYSRDEAVGQTPRLLKSGLMQEQEYADLWRNLRSGREWRGTFHNRRKDGSLYWDHSTISPIINPDGGEVTHFVAVKEDITEEKEAEQLRYAVLQLSADVAGCATEDEICRVVVEGIREKMHVDRCGLFLGDPEDPVFHGTYGTDLNGHTTDEHDHAWNIRAERDVEELFASATFKSGFPLGRPESRPGEEDLASTFVALRQSGRVFGIISIDNRMSRRPVTNNQMSHIALLAEVLGNALQVARAREETNRANEELEAFNRAMVGRELRVIELKEEVNALLNEQGKPNRYEPIWNKQTEDHAPRRGKSARR